MKTAFSIVLVALILVGVVAYGYPSGIAGRTLKNSSLGCGGSGCHSGGPSGSVSVSIAGPDSVVAGQSASYAVTVTGSSGSKGGVDIAAWSGTLTPVSSTLKFSNGDVVHKQRVSVPSTYEFTYTAPLTPGKDTLYAVGKDNIFSGWNWSPKKTITVISVTSVDDPSTPVVFELHQNYPNPFNPTTVIEYSIPREAHVTLQVYDLLGNAVATVVNESQPQGTHSVIFDGKALASGLYFYRLEAGPFVQTKRFILIR